VVKKGYCDECGDYDLLGYIDQSKKNLCPWCVGQALGISKEVVREDLKRQLEEMHQQVVSKEGEKENGS